MKALGILLSGRGSNFAAIAENVASGKIRDARIAIVISNRPDAGGIETAKRLGLATLVLVSKNKEREEHDRAVAAALEHHLLGLQGLAHRRQEAQRPLRRGRLAQGLQLLP